VYKFAYLLTFALRDISCKVRKAWICIAPPREHTSKALRYGTRSQRISQFYLHTPCSFANVMNYTCICLPSQRWYSFTDPEGMEGWVGVLYWLEGFQRSLAQIFTMWVGIAEKVVKVRGQVHDQSEYMYWRRYAFRRCGVEAEVFDLRCRHFADKSMHLQAVTCDITFQMWQLTHWPASCLTHQKYCSFINCALNHYQVPSCKS